jgi:hypothetical protein
MSLNDPHLEAQMELENRYPHRAEPAPQRFNRRVALAIGLSVALLALVWLAIVIAGSGRGEPPAGPRKTPSRPPRTAPAGVATSSVDSSPSVPVGMVKVPDVQGRIDADEALEAAGLRPHGIAVHGPIEEDCAGYMEAYRQRPAAGTLVKKGSKVTYRFWWESQ